MSQSQKEQHQLVEHTVQFALAVRDFGKVIPMTVSNVEDLKQLIRASGAVGANFIAACESSNRNDYMIGIKASIKECRSTFYWLRLIDTQGDPELEQRREQLKQASQEMAKVFSTIIQTASVR